MSGSSLPDQRQIQETPDRRGDHRGFLTRKRAFLAPRDIILLR